MEQLWKAVKLGGIPVGISITAFGIAQGASEASSWGIPFWVWVLVGWLIFVLTACFIIAGFYRENKRLKKGIATGIEIIANRSNLPKIKEEFADTSVGYVLWFTGYEARNDWPILRDKIQRIIFIDPELCNTKPFLKHIIEKWEKEPNVAIDSIKEFSREAASEYTKVKWLGKQPNELIVISNPYADKAWARIENFDLEKHSSEWDSIRIYKKQQPLLFKAILSKYEILWNEISREP